MFSNDVYPEVSVMLVGSLIWVDLNSYIIMKEILEVMRAHGSEKESESYLRVTWYLLNFPCSSTEAKPRIGSFASRERGYGNHSWFRHLTGVGAKLLIANRAISNSHKCLDVALEIINSRLVFDFARFSWFPARKIKVKWFQLLSSSIIV